jgi:hypothetical protein
MNLGQLASRARELVQRRGGTESVKQDAEELRDIASGPGSMSDKAKAAAGAIKDPGADDTPRAAHTPPSAGASEPAAQPQAQGEEAAAQPEDAPGGRGRRGRGGRRRGRRRR